MKYLEKVISCSGIEKQLVERTEKVALYRVCSKGSKIPKRYEVIKPIVKDGISYKKLEKTESKEIYPPIECLHVRLWIFQGIDEAAEKYSELFYK